MNTLDERISRLTPMQRELLQRKMAEMNKKNKKNEILLTLQEGNTAKRRPVFCLHPPLGVTGYYINIVRHLDPEQPVYGIQSPAFYGIREPFDNMEEMAAYYLDAIRSIQPEPPYSLIAHSSAAFIAYEMALQLDNHIENIPVMIFIDQAAPIGPLDEIMDTFNNPDLTESDEVLFLTSWLVSLIHNQELPFTLEDIKMCPTIEDKYRLVADFLKKTGFIPVNADNNMVKVVLKMIASHAAADYKYHTKYTPDGSSTPYNGQIVLLRCTKETVWKGLDATSQPDTSKSSNWDKFCSRPIDVIGIPDADHISMVLEEHCVKDIARNIQSYLDKVTPIA